VLDNRKGIVWLWGRLGYVSIGTDGRIRTDTGGGLSAVPLPVLGYVSVVDRAGSNPRPSPCRGAALPVAPSAHACVWRVRGSNPPDGGYGPPLITRSPAVVYGRLRSVGATTECGA
jgi:hypothetical protein